LITFLGEPSFLRIAIHFLTTERASGKHFTPFAINNTTDSVDSKLCIQNPTVVKSERKNTPSGRSDRSVLKKEQTYAEASADQLKIC
jgi:hypothetical protein